MKLGESGFGWCVCFLYAGLVGGDLGMLRVADFILGVGGLVGCLVLEVGFCMGVIECECICTTSPEGCDMNAIPDYNAKMGSVSLISHAMRGVRNHHYHHISTSLPNLLCLLFCTLL